MNSIIQLRILLKLQVVFLVVAFVATVGGTVIPETVDEGRGFFVSMNSDNLNLTRHL